MKRILLCLLCAALLTGCGKETDPAVAAAQRYQPIVQAVGDGTAAGVDLTDAQIAQAVAELDAAGLTAVHVDAADPVAHPETVTAFWDGRAAGETAEIALYEDALLWAYEAGIVAGTTSTTFSPAKECTRAEMVCFLVRLLSDGATDNMPFVDVPASAWYYNEVQWAWANGLTVGTSATTFSPDKVCTRAEAVEFLYNAFAE